MYVKVPKIKVVLIGYKKYEMRFAFTCSLRIEIIVMSRNTNVGRDSLHAKLVQATEVESQANIETDFLIAIWALYIVFKLLYFCDKSEIKVSYLQ